MDEINPLPYLITFAVLFLVLLGVFTWALRVWYQEFQCGINPNIWCRDDWTCTKTCPEAANSPFNDCFIHHNTIGLSSCLFGPNSSAANLCYNLPEGDQPTTPACDCPTMMTETQSCFSGCPYNLGDVQTYQGSKFCCCKTNDPNCAAGSPACQPPSS